MSHETPREALAQLLSAVKGMRHIRPEFWDEDEIATAVDAAEAVMASPPAADTGLIEELEKLRDKWRDATVWEHDEFNQCADDLQELLTRVSGQSK